MPTIDTPALSRALAVRDLTDPAQGAHAMQLLVDRAEEALIRAWGARAIRWRAHPITTVADNYDRLGYSEAAAARDARYTRYLNPRELLRSHTSAMIPPLLRLLAPIAPDDVLLVCPGLVYRRDAIDRLHTGEPHQLDLWRVAQRPLAAPDLQRMIEQVVSALLPGRSYRTVAAEHPYTEQGLQIDVADGAGWVEIGECGLAHPAVLASSGLAEPHRGLAMGIGLDRVLMLHKGISDIRLLRSRDPRVAEQMLDLSAYRPVSNQPAIVRDLSLALDPPCDAEKVGDLVREALDERAAAVERVELRSTTPYADLPPAAVARLGMRPGQINALVRVVLRDLDRTLTHAEANELRDTIYAALHRGARGEWAARHSPGGGASCDDSTPQEP